MAIQVHCPKCSRRYAVPDGLAGQPGLCVCGEVLSLPGAEAASPANEPPVISSRAAEPRPPRDLVARLASIDRTTWWSLGAALVMAILLSHLHDRMYLARVWPRCVPLLLVDAWLCAGATAAVLMLARRPRLSWPAAVHGLLVGYSCGLLVWPIHYGAGASSWLAPFIALWPSFAFMRAVVGLFIGLATCAVALRSQRLLDDPDDCRGALAVALRALTAPLAGVRLVLLPLAWWGATLVTALLHTHFRIFPPIPAPGSPFSAPVPTFIPRPLEPWQTPAIWQEIVYWLALLIVPTCFAFWSIRRARRGAAVPLSSPLAFVGVQLGLALSLTLWRVPLTQAGSTVLLAAILGLVGVWAATARAPQAAARAPRTARARASVALTATGVAVATLVVGLWATPALQAQLWKYVFRATRMHDFAISRLASVGGAEASLVLLELSTGPDPTAAKKARDALKRSTRRAARGLARMIPAADLRRRVQIANLLGEGGQKEAVEPLIALLQDSIPVPPKAPPRNPTPPDPATYRYTPQPVPFEPEATVENVHGAAAQALAKLKDPAAGEALTAALGRDPSHFVRESAAKALGEIAYLPAIPALRQAISDSVDDVRAASAEALAKLDDRESLPLILALLKTSDAVAVRPLARAVAALGDETAVQPLRDAIARGEWDTDGLKDLLDACEKLGGDTLEPLTKAALNMDGMNHDSAGHELLRRHPDEGLATLGRLLEDPAHAAAAARILQLSGLPPAQQMLRAHGRASY
jgi:HEAT repeat protein